MGRVLGAMTIPGRLSSNINIQRDFPCGSAGKDSPSMWETWVGKIPWRRERLSTPVLWPGEVHGLYSGVGEDS